MLTPECHRNSYNCRIYPTYPSVKEFWLCIAPASQLFIYRPECLHLWKILYHAFILHPAVIFRFLDIYSMHYATWLCILVLTSWLKWSENLVDYWCGKTFSHCVCTYGCTCQRLFESYAITFRSKNSKSAGGRIRTQYMCLTEVIVSFHESIIQQAKQRLSVVMSCIAWIVSSHHVRCHNWRIHVTLISLLLDCRGDVH